MPRHREYTRVPFSLKMLVSSFIMVGAMTVAAASLTLAENDHFRVNITLDPETADAEQVVVQQEKDKRFEDHLQLGIYARLDSMKVRQIKLRLEFDHSHVEGAQPFGEQRVEYVFGGSEPDWTRARSERLKAGALSMVYPMDRAPKKLYVRCREEGYSFTNTYDVRAIMLDGSFETRSRDPLYIDAEILPSEIVNNIVQINASQYNIIATPNEESYVELRFFPTEPTKIFYNRMMPNRRLPEDTRVSWTLYKIGEDQPLQSARDVSVGTDGVLIRLPDRLKAVMGYRLNIEAYAPSCSYEGPKLFSGRLDLQIMDAATTVYDMDFVGNGIQMPDTGYGQLRLESFDAYAFEIQPIGCPLNDGRRAVVERETWECFVRSEDETILQVLKDETDLSGKSYWIFVNPETTARTCSIVAAIDNGGMAIERVLEVHLPGADQSVSSPTEK